MTFAIVIVVLFVLLFLLAFMTKRRFGVLTLALAAGTVLAQLWSSSLTPYVASLGIDIVKPPLVEVVALILTLLPSLILLFSGPAAHKKLQRIGGSIVFALLAVLLMFDSLRNALVIDSVGEQIIQHVMLYSPIAITICLVLAIFDVLQTHTRRSEPRKK